MKRAIQDRLKQDYGILVRCPFIPKANLRVCVCKDFESRTNSRPDLLRVIDDQWETVYYENQVNLI